MRITRYGHSCLLVEEGDARVLLDPGVFSSGFEELRGLTAVLVTHQHADHLDPARLRALLEANPDAALHVDSGTAAALDGLPHTVVAAGDVLDVGVRVDVLGSEHAVIHPDIPRDPQRRLPRRRPLLHARGRAARARGRRRGARPADRRALAQALRGRRPVPLVAPRVAFPVHDAVLSGRRRHLVRPVRRAQPRGQHLPTVAPDGVVPLD